jgi:hypothetical protein
MKLTDAQLRTLIREEMMRGIPDFLIQEAIDGMLEKVRGLVLKHVLEYRSQSRGQQQEALEALNDAVGDWKLELYELMENNLDELLRDL